MKIIKILCFALLTQSACLAELPINISETRKSYEEGLELLTNVSLNLEGEQQVIWNKQIENLEHIIRELRSIEEIEAMTEEAKGLKEYWESLANKTKEKYEKWKEKLKKVQWGTFILGATGAAVCITLLYFGYNKYKAANQNLQHVNRIQARTARRERVVRTMCKMCQTLQAEQALTVDEQDLDKIRFLERQRDENLQRLQRLDEMEAREVWVEVTEQDMRNLLNHQVIKDIENKGNNTKRLLRRGQRERRERYKDFTKKAKDLDRKLTPRLESSDEEDEGEEE